MNRSALMAVATLGALAFASVAVAADEPSEATGVSIIPEHAFAMRFHLDRDARVACGIDTNQGRMSMRTWQRQHECLRDYFSGTLR